MYSQYTHVWGCLHVCSCIYASKNSLPRPDFVLCKYIYYYLSNPTGQNCSVWQVWVAVGAAADAGCWWLQGQFAEGFMHGKGKYTWADGVEYEVSWQFVKLHLRFIHRIYILVDVLCLFLWRMTYTTLNICTFLIIIVHWYSTVLEGQGDLGDIR